MQSQISNPFCPLGVMHCRSYCDRSFINKNCDNSFINKPAFLNFVPQLIRKINVRDSSAGTYFFNDKLLIRLMTEKWNMVQFSFTAESVYLQNQ